MLVDDIKISVAAGKGGDGVVAFNKNMKELGPTGGTGGNGGNVLMEGVSDIGALQKFRYKKDFKIKNAENGQSKNRDGAVGEDLILTVPVGTVIHNLTNGSSVEVNKIGEVVTIAKGGRGGKGNFHFRSSTNTTPMEFEPGKDGEAFDLRLELKLIADVGLVGLPNIGKSSFLNQITNAKSKVANYSFTTLEPSLGAYYELIIADIPGLIAGASEGKGLGIKFLRHIERTKVLFHFISADSKNPLEDYKTVRNELENHSKSFLEKPEYIIISRKDNVSEERLKEVRNELIEGVSGKNIEERIFAISILEDESLVPVKKLLNKLIEEKQKLEEAK
jgi:GTP-binding protein